VTDAATLVDELVVTLPPWTESVLDAQPACRSDEDRMRLVLTLAEENVRRGSGGPFGAAVFACGAARPLAVGVNSVERLANAVLHAEVVALMLAGARRASYSLRAPGAAPCELFTSCAPCAMCLGAALWSGVSRIVCSAAREDALALGFEEGPVFPESWRYLESHGVEIEHGLLAAEGRAVLALYRERRGLVYNP